jgi:pyridoxal phosphate enzyme (YggS family)
VRTIKQNLHNVQNRIATISQYGARAPEEVTLLAVSKTKHVAAIAEAIAAGQRIFGENYVQEGVDKIQHFAALPEEIALEWHFIDQLQSNKSCLVAEHFAWYQTVDRLHIAERLNDQRPATIAPLNVLIQINISDEQSKYGIVLDALPWLAEAIVAMPNLILRGLMAIPALEVVYTRQLAVFSQINDAFLELQ